MDSEKPGSGLKREGAPTDTKASLPRIPHAILRVLVPRSARASIFTDLEEGYSRILHSEGRARANRWYWLQALKSSRLWVFRGLRRERSRGRRIGIGRTFSGDLRFALRRLRTRPLFAGMAILTIGIGIGATTAVFAVVDGILLRALPYEDSGRLVTVWNTYLAWRDHEILGDLWDQVSLSYPEYELLREEGELFDDLAIAGQTRKTLTGSGDPVELVVGLSSHGLFPLLGVEPVLGRVFQEGEDGPAPGHLALLSHDLWVSRFGGDPGVIGSGVLLDSRPFTIVGVLPPGFRLRSLGSGDDDGHRDLWIPVGAQGLNRLSPDLHAYEGIARLPDGATPAQAEDDAVRLFEEIPGFPRGARVEFRADEEVELVRTPLLILLCTAGLLLLVACANVASLILGEVANRKHELLTRTALGASLGRVAGQLLSEGLLIGGLGGVVGALLAVQGARLLVTLAPDTMPQVWMVALDGRVFGFAALVAIGSGVLFGLVPLIGWARGKLEYGLQETAGKRVAGVGSSQRLLVGAQFAVTATLLVGMGLLGRSFIRIISVDPGFSTENISTFRLALSKERYTDEEATVFFRELRSRIGALPGVVSVSGGTPLPFSGSRASQSVVPEGVILTEEDPAMPEADRRIVQPDFFETLDLSLLEGRALDENDRADGPLVAVISQTFAQSFWSGETAIGKTFGADGRTFSIVGVVNDIHHKTLDTAPRMTFYVARDQFPEPEQGMLVRYRGERDGIVTAVYQAVWSLDPNLPITEAGTMDGWIERSLAGQRYQTFLFTVFGLLASALAACGVFVATFRGVALRTRELGIRMTLGAHTRELIRSAVWNAVKTAALGIVGGMAGAVVLTRFLDALPFAVELRDPWVYAGVTVALAGMAVLSAYLPARRVSRLDPASSLRTE